jgi:hypothetical protein
MILTSKQTLLPLSITINDRFMQSQLEQRTPVPATASHVTQLLRHVSESSSDSKQFSSRSVTPGSTHSSDSDAETPFISCAGSTHSYGYLLEEVERNLALLSVELERKEQLNLTQESVEFILRKQQKLLKKRDILLHIQDLSLWYTRYKTTTHSTHSLHY